jgi:hypothetical protein
MKHTEFSISTIYMYLIVCIFMVLINKYIDLKCMEWTTLKVYVPHKFTHNIPSSESNRNLYGDSTFWIFT